MSRQIIELIQFGTISIGTAKRVLRDLKEKGLKVAGKVPVTRARNRAGFSIEEGINVPRREPNPLETSLHEHGHYASTRGRRLLYKMRLKKEAKYLPGKGIYEGEFRADDKYMVGSEMLANKAVLESIQKHGTALEAEAWKKTSRNQIRAGYTLPMFKSRAYPEGTTLSDKKKLVREMPWIARKNTELSSLSALIRFERVENPIFRKGVKSGVHRIGEGKEKMIRIRSIVSPQWGIDKGKVSKMARKKNLHPPVVSHLGHGVYVLKDGNHRVNAILRQGKRKILAKVQKL